MTTTTTRTNFFGMTVNVQVPMTHDEYLAHRRTRRAARKAAQREAEAQDAAKRDRRLAARRARRIERKQRGQVA